MALFNNYFNLVNILMTTTQFCIRVCIAASAIMGLHMILTHIA